jgi:hypothetical protein
MNIQMKGQCKAVSQAIAWTGMILRGMPIRPALISGPAGVGKSHLVSQIVSPLEDSGWNIVKIDSAFEAFRTLAAFEEMIIKPLSYDIPTVLVLDEAHALKGASGVSKAATIAFQSALFPWGCGTPETGTLAMGRENNPEFSWRRTALILATNNAEELEQSASRKKGETPFKRRMTSIDLSPYGEDAIGEVIGDYLTSQGLRASDCSKGIIARFHRKTLGAISAVVGAYKALYPDSPVLSKDRLLEAAKLTDYLPRGLTKFEGRLLRELASANGAIRKDGAAIKVGVESAMMPGIIAQLDSQKDAAGNHCPFVVVSGNAIGITPAGEKYLSAILRDGFTL